MNILKLLRTPIFIEHNECNEYNECERMTASDNEWQRVTTNDKEWQRMTNNDNKWQWVTANDSKWYKECKAHNTLQRMYDCHKTQK